MLRPNQMIIRQLSQFRPRLIALALTSLLALQASFAPATLETTGASSASAATVRIAPPAAPTDGATPCASLTPAAIQQIIDVLAQSISKARLDVAANGVTGAYASAARDNLLYLKQAHSTMVALQTWLREHGLDTPYVTNTTAANNVHNYVRETVTPLHYARHWASISAVHHESTDALDSFQLTSQALALLEPLGAQAGRCYLRGYFPTFP